MGPKGHYPTVKPRTRSIDPRREVQTQPKPPGPRSRVDPRAEPLARPDGPPPSSRATPPTMPAASPRTPQRGPTPRSAGLARSDFTSALLPGWSEDLCVGNGQIDREHKTFYLRALRLAIACEEGHAVEEIVSALRYFGEYATAHFRTEEDLMRAVGFRDLATHCAAHAAFAGRVAGLEVQMAAQGDAMAIAREVAAMTAEWFSGHIRNDDQALARYLEDTKIG